MDDAHKTVAAMLADQLQAARARVEDTGKTVTDLEAKAKPAKAAHVTAKLEVERIERAIKVYEGNRIKRPRSKKDPAPPPPKAEDAKKAEETKGKKP